MSVPQEIKDRLDIVQYIQEHVPGLKKSGRYYKAICPFHSEDTPSFVVNPETQSWRCFGACAEGGDLFTFAQKMHGWSFKEALNELGERAGVQVHDRSPRQKQQDERDKRLRGILSTAADYYHKHLLSDDPQAQQALQYTLHERGFSQETIEQFQIGYAPKGWRNMLDALTDLGYEQQDIIDSGIVLHNKDKNSVYDRFRHRLVIPIADKRGRIVGFGGRILDEDDYPKYLNTPQTDIFDKSGLLFGLNHAKRAIRDTETAVIVEGYMDVIQAHQAGYANVVAQMGTAMTETQLKLIAPRYAHTVIMALDADEAGQNATRRSLEVARKALEADYMGKMEVDIRVLRIDGAKDPDDVLRETPQKWPQYVQQARPVADFVIDLETSSLEPGAGVQQKQRVARDILPLLMASENNFYRQENIQKLALKLRISEADLLMWAQELQRINERKQSTKRKRYSDPPPTFQEEDKGYQDAYRGDNHQDAYLGIGYPDTQQAEAYRDDDEDPLPPESRREADSDHMPPPMPEHLLDESAIPPPADDEREYLPYDPDNPPPKRSSENGAAPQKQTQAPKQKPRSRTEKQLISKSSSRATEAYCLRMLLLQPALLAQINRKLRELAGNRAMLSKGPLSDLMLEDFTQSEYRAILDTLQDALAQDDADPLDYLRQQLDDTLADELDDLLRDEADDVHQLVKHSLKGEFEEIWSHYNRRVKPGVNVERELVTRALYVRRQRLERESREIRFLMEDARRSNDKHAERKYFEQTVPTMQALKILQHELQQAIQLL